MIENIYDSFKHTFITENKLCIVKAEGKISFNSSIGEMIKVINNPEFDTNYRIIVDLTEISYNPSYKEIEGIKNKLIQLKPYFKQKIALISVGSISVIAYLIAQFAKYNGLKIKTFTTLDNAYEWLNEVEELVNNL